MLYACLPDNGYETVRNDADLRAMGDEAHLGEPPGSRRLVGHLVSDVATLCSFTLKTMTGVACSVNVTVPGGSKRLKRDARIVGGSLTR
jgi:hypothetical protein